MHPIAETSPVLEKQPNQTAMAHSWPLIFISMHVKKEREKERGKTKHVCCLLIKIILKIQ